MNVIMDVFDAWKDIQPIDETEYGRFRKYCNKIIRYMQIVNRRILMKNTVPVVFALKK
jgi:hypothetical protein